MWIPPRGRDTQLGRGAVAPRPSCHSGLTPALRASNDVAIDHGPFEVNAYAGTMPEAEIADFAAEVAKYG